MVADPVLERFLREAIAPLRPKLKTAYLFGSRAKDTARPDSDYDVLLVVADSFMLRDKDALYDVVMDILLDTGRLVSLKIVKEAQFDKLCGLRTPFMTHILTEGVKVG